MATEKQTEGGTKYTDFTEQLKVTTKEDKKQLLALMAQHGTEAKRIFAEQKAAGQATRQAGIDRGPGPALAGSSLDAISRMQGGVARSEERAGASHARELARIQAANAAYLDQVRSQITIEELPEGYGGSGGSRGSSGGGGGGLSAGYELGDGLLPDLSVPSSDPSDLYFAYSEAQAEAGDFTDKAKLPVKIREVVDRMIANGSDRNEIGDYIYDTLAASELTRSQQAQVMATLDNHYGISEDGVNGTAVADIYYSEEDKEFDRFKNRAESGRRSDVDDKIAKRESAMARLQRAQDVLASLGDVESEELPTRRGAQKGELSGLNTVLARTEAEAARSEAQRELNLMDQADEDLETAAVQDRQARRPKDPAEEARARQVLADRKAREARQAEIERKRAAEAAQRRKEAARSNRNRAASNRHLQQMQARARQQRLEAIRESYGDLFDRDLEENEDEFLDRYDDEQLEKMAAARRRAASRSRRTRAF